MKKVLLLLTTLFASGALIANEYVRLSTNPNTKNAYYSLNDAVKGRLSETKSDTLFVVVEEGNYYMDAPFTIDQANTRPIVIKSETVRKPRFTGGMKIENWEKCGDNLFRAYVPEMKRFGFVFEQFYVDQKRAQLARTPNHEWNYVKGCREVGFVKGPRFFGYAAQTIIFDPAELNDLKELKQSEIERVKFRFYHKWDNTQKRAEYVECDSGFVFVRGEGMHPWNMINRGSRYIMYNYRGALDCPGEWFPDCETGYLYYMPKEDEDMSRAECYVPVIHQFIDFKGTPGQVIQNITFDNLSFNYASYVTPASGDEPIQAAAPAEAAMMFDFTENMVIKNCEVMHTGAYGIWLKQACHNNRIEGTYLYDLGAGGIKIGEPYKREWFHGVTSNNVIDNNIITHGGSELPCGVGIAMLHTSNNKITHNEISDFRYSGISIGWIWGYNQSDQIWTSHINKRGRTEFYHEKFDSPSVGNIVEYNHIHHIGWGELSDMGAVYTLGESPGTRVSYNVIHDILSYDYGGWGLYTDEGSRGIEMSNNLVYRCKSGGFHQHYGKDNKIVNNIFAFGHFYQLQYSRVETHLSFTFKHNIILQDKGVTLAGPWDKGKIEMDSNCYWSVKGDLKFSGMNFNDWQKIKDANSVVGDPMFKNPLKDDYTFKSLKTARKIGFTPFDYSKAGVYGSPEWIEKAKLDSKIWNEFEQAAKTRLKN